MPNTRRRGIRVLSFIHSVIFPKARRIGAKPFSSFSCLFVVPLKNLSQRFEEPGPYAGGGFAHAVDAGKVAFADEAVAFGGGGSYEAERGEVGEFGAGVAAFIAAAQFYWQAVYFF